MFYIILDEIEVISIKRDEFHEKAYASALREELYKTTIQLPPLPPLPLQLSLNFFHIFSRVYSQVELETILFLLRASKE